MRKTIAFEIDAENTVDLLTIHIEYSVLPVDTFTRILHSIGNLYVDLVLLLPIQSDTLAIATAHTGNSITFSLAPRGIVPKLKKPKKGGGIEVSVPQWLAAMALMTILLGQATSFSKSLLEGYKTYLENEKLRREIERMDLEILEKSLKTPNSKVRENLLLFHSEATWTFIESISINGEPIQRQRIRKFPSERIV